MAMLGGECSACCDDPCGGCKAPSWGSARRFVQSLASLNGTQYTGLSVDTGEVTNSAFAVQSGGGWAQFEGARIHPQLAGHRGYILAAAGAGVDSGGDGCVYGYASLYIPFGGYFLDDQGSRYRYLASDDRYPYSTGARIVATVPYNEFEVFFNRQAAWRSPNIIVYPPDTGYRFWYGNTSKPIITSIRFGGKSITATPWDGVSEPTINNAIFGNSAEIFPSSNCKWRGGPTDPRKILSVPDANYRGPLEIDWAIFRSFVAGQDDNGDNIEGYALAGSGTVTVQWDDMTEFEVDEDCNSGACCEVDGSCNIKPQCECDTENGAVFAGVGETCEACAPVACCPPSADWLAKHDEYMANAPALQGFTSARLTRRNANYETTNFDVTRQDLAIDGSGAYPVCFPAWENIAFTTGFEWASWRIQTYGLVANNTPDVGARLFFQFMTNGDSSYAGFQTAVGIICQAPLGSPPGTPERFMLSAFHHNRRDSVSNGYQPMEAKELNIGGLALQFTPLVDPGTTQTVAIDIPSPDWLNSNQEFTITYEGATGDSTSGDWTWYGKLPPGLVDVTCSIANPLP